MKRNDTRTAIKATLKNASGNPIDLTGCTVKFIMSKGKAVIVNREAEVMEAPSGKVLFVFSLGETDMTGTVVAEFEVKYQDESIETFPNAGYIKINFESDLG